MTEKPSTHPWRLQSQARGQGRYFTLIRGSATDRISIGLGVVSDEAAQRYLKGMTWVDRVWKDYGWAPHPAATIGPDGKFNISNTMDISPPKHFTPPRYTMARGETPGSVGTLIDPQWVIDHTRRGPAEREEVLRFLWATGEFLENDEAGSPREQAPPPPPDIVMRGLPVPNMFSSMPLEQYVWRIWEPVRRSEHPSSWERETYFWSHYILPQIGEHRLGSLEKRGFDGFLRGLRLDDGTAPAGATLRLLKYAYKACLEYAEREGHIKEAHEYYRIKGSTEAKRPEPEPLTEEERSALIAAAPSPCHAALFAVDMEAGLRPSEIVRLRWEDITWEEAGRYPWGKFRVRGTKTRESTAYLPMGPQGRALLEALWKSLRQPKEGSVFTWRGKPIANFRTALASAAKRAGMTKVVNRYLLRHTFGTMAMEGGFNVADVARYMRHSNPRMLSDCYDHSEAADRIPAEKLFRKTKE